jgi:ornithine cyclodeaminase
MAIDEGHANAAELVPLADVVRGVTSVDRDRPHVFKSVGMGWEDLVVAAACVAAAG